MFDKIIEVEKRAIAYGKEHIYAVNDQAKKAEKLLGQKSMTVKNLTDLKNMGFVIKQVVVANGKAIEVGYL